MLRFWRPIYHFLRRISIAYALVGLALWGGVLQSGVHATIAGVLLGFCVPLRVPAPLSVQWEKRLHGWVAYAVLPLFAFFNAGVRLWDLSLTDAMLPLPLGIACALLLGKQQGVFGAAWLMARLGVAKKPQNIGWLPLYGVSILAGIGFTMSFFIGILAFPDVDNTQALVRLGVLTGSLFSALAGYIFLAFVLNRRAVA